jgi:hypothetical protein
MPAGFRNFPVRMPPVGLLRQADVILSAESMRKDNRQTQGLHTRWEQTGKGWEKPERHSAAPRRGTDSPPSRQDGRAGDDSMEPPSRKDNISSYGCYSVERFTTKPFIFLFF